MALYKINNVWAHFAYYQHGVYAQNLSMAPQFGITDPFIIPILNTVSTNFFIKLYIILPHILTILIFGVGPLKIFSN